MSQAAKNQAAPAGPASPAPKLAALAAEPLPRRHAILVLASTILVMAMLLGRDDSSRGPLWHLMWMGSLVVVLGSLLGGFAKRLGRGGPQAAAKPVAARRPGAGV